VVATTDNPEALTLEPIGFVRTSFGSRVEAPRQPAAARSARGRIELLPGRNFEHALEDLEGWQFIWVVFWFHLNTTWRPKVLPPRSVSGRKGLFSTRSPHRPNPIGLSAVRLERVAGLTLHVSDLDMVDGTPVLDIKPYVPYTDSHPGARSGWLEETGRSAGEGTPADPVSGYAVSFDAVADEQAGWIEARTGLALRERIRATLELGPQPHPYRRIRREGNGLLLAIKEWRVRFSVTGRDVRVTSIASGYRQAQLAAPDRPVDALLTAHREFAATWQQPGTPDPPHVADG
jgi:tRNA-Thr(GGU) m(6)t(6)A37 methyltransferase TsaA